MADDILLHMLWSRTRTAGVEEDAAMITMHFQTPDTSWPTTPPENYEGCEAALDAWWTRLKVAYTAAYKLVEYRWYRKDSGAEHWGPPGRVTARSVAGGATDPGTPPQCALVVTEFTDYQEREDGRTIRHWGRFYLPALSSFAHNGDGTVKNFYVDEIADATADLYEAIVARGLKPSVHVTRFGDPPLPVTVPIKEIRVNNIVDTQRSRKWDTITYQRNIDLPDYWGD